MTRTRTNDGTTIEFVTRDGREIVLLSDANDPEIIEAGWIYRGPDGHGFRPTLYAMVALRPAALRAIADHVEQGGQ